MNPREPFYTYEFNIGPIDYVDSRVKVISYMDSDYGFFIEIHIVHI